MTTPVNVNYRQGIIDRFVEVLDDMIHDDEFDPLTIYQVFVEAVTVDRDYYQKGVDRCNLLLKKVQPSQLQQERSQSPFSTSVYGDKVIFGGYSQDTISLG